MHPVRRRKKRPNYGVRTVEVKRGQNGFGFTISGQHPCILSCIVAGSPAESAGLRAGDYLVAVEGQSVSKVPHDDVVRLIGCSNGVLKLQIAENYYSDSSDDDVPIMMRQKPKYPHKYLNNRHAETLHNRGSKLIRDIRMNNCVFQTRMSCPLSPPRNVKHPDQWKLENHIPPPISRYHHRTAGCEEPNVNDVEVFRAIVGYVGTIEMPRKLPAGSRLQIVRGCIKRLRAEKRSHTAVLMTVMTHSLRLTNGAGITLAIYPGNRVIFCGASSDKDHKHFGVVTAASGEDPSSSCHIFAVDARPHSNHFKRAKIFKLECQTDPVSGICKEFPPNCDPIIAVIKGFYETEVNAEEPVVANSPQPSHDSTTTTSNSDSGIGFRDDCGNQSDRILVVDVQNHRLHIQEVDKVGNKAEKVTVHAIPNVAAASIRSRSPLSTGSEGPVLVEDMSISSGATKSPDVTVIQQNKKSFCELNVSVRSADDMSISSSRSHDALLFPYKLSPKAFPLSPPTSQSLEDLKEPDITHCLPRIHQPHWGSLQDLRTFNTNGFDGTSASQTLHEGHEEGVSGWATSFEKLLEDPVGLHTFAEFLKKEFSHENIYFWVACENYQQITDEAARKEKAREIFERHLALGALEPVNVDSYARQVTEEQLDNAYPNLFIQAQKQIFNLMKFDSYPRFLKSELYKECVVRVLAGEELSLPSNSGGLHLNLSQVHSKLKKSRSDADERRRKSLLPWTKKTRTKSRDRFGGVLDHDNSSVSSSRSSLTTWDLSLSSGLCRVILPDGSTAVIHTRPDQTVRDTVSRLLLKRSLSYNDFQVFHSYTNKAIPLEEDASVLSGLEVSIERRIIFRLDLPNRKTIVVKSKQGKTLYQVLKPILQKYGYRLEMVTLCLMSENEVLEPNMSVTLVDNQRIQVLTRSTPTELLPQIGGWRTAGDCTKGKSLDEITNRVFEELLQGKAEASLATPSDQGSVRSEDWSSENSGILGRFWRRESTFIDKQRKSKKGVSKCDENERKTTLSKLPPLIAKLKPGSKLESRSESDVLYEGLKRAQRCRLEDQRGTEINFELPDFLKDKENAPQNGKKIRKIRDEEPENKFFSCDTTQLGTIQGGKVLELFLPLQTQARKVTSLDIVAICASKPPLLDNTVIICSPSVNGDVYL
ncbi:regulator of G-protein signaling loco isoform X2 [Halyomorpha halys]|uniref:regulator of G-protein signaling loco isoform X2 n=1 Tax=Halyomorpha halys TaxID=286706 RepID=UPI0006D515AE|nr:regulator of G-protein signaling loco isoform X2 [Halyomorpha halys]